jgi:hypothetical protein
MRVHADLAAYDSSLHDTTKQSGMSALKADALKLDCFAELFSGPMVSVGTVGL